MELVDVNNLSEDKIAIAIKNNFPNISKNEVTSAEIGRELRGMLPSEKQIEQFPNKKELQNILANTTQEILKPEEFSHFKTHHQLKKKSKEYEESIGFYYVRGNFDLTYNLRFIWLEDLIKKWIKQNDLDFQEPIKLSLFISLKQEFNEMIRFSSYHELANKFYVRVKFLIEDVIPKYRNYMNLIELNRFLNYSMSELDSFSGIRRWGVNDSRIILVNPIVSILAKDNSCDRIIEEEVLRNIENEIERVKYRKAFEELKGDYDA